MDITTLPRRLYSLAFRLTGEKETASKLILAVFTANNRPSLWRASSEVSKFFLASCLEICCRYWHNFAGSDGKNTSIEPQKRQGPRDDLQGALLDLKPLERMVVVWRDIADLPMAELTSIVNLPLNELYLILGQARQRLRRRL
ncbi:MAG: hypothetical protein GX349_07890 [Firmicutes bacterium]|nr:hypothetical protein [Bacillota bacterium]